MEQEEHGTAKDAITGVRIALMMDVRLPLVPRVVVAVTGLLAAGCTTLAGWSNPSLLLRGIFVLWVVLPYLAMAWLLRGFESIARHKARAIGLSMLALAVMATALIAFFTFGPSLPQRAFPFLAIPAALWLALAPIGLAARHSGERR